MSKRGKAGFTLVEILIVLSIIGVLILAIMVNFRRGDRSNDLRQVSIELVQHIRLAQGYTTGGSSLYFCNVGTDNEFEKCADDSFCNSPLIVGSCANNVPGGGYGLTINNDYSYSLFANTNTSPAYFDIKDPVIVQKDNLTKGVKIPSFKIGESTYSPAASRLDVIFTPPIGTISFYIGDTLVTTENVVEILVQNDYISDTCKKITINRISGQISESQSSCVL